MSAAHQAPSSRGGRPAQGVEVVSMTVDMVPRVCDLHVNAFAGLMSVRLGPAYLRAFFSWFLRAPDAVALVAADQQRAILGYVIGAPRGYTTAMNRELVSVAARSMIARPWLLLNSQVRATSKARLGFLLGRSAVDTSDLPGPTMSLVGIAVSPSAAGKGVGFDLMQAFEKKARASRMASLHLSVYPDNIAARRLYERCGWHSLDLGSSTGAIYYGRVMS
jgi:ribosomal protein S18 acetylase RimI-like enzyme